MKFLSNLQYLTFVLIKIKWILIIVSFSISKIDQVKNQIKLL